MKSYFIGTVLCMFGIGWAKFSSRVSRNQRMSAYEVLNFVFLSSAAMINVWITLLPLTICALNSTVASPVRKVGLCMAKQACVFVVDPS
jgi:hypothetical protein